MRLKLAADSSEQEFSLKIISKKILTNTQEVSTYKSRLASNCTKYTTSRINNEKIKNLLLYIHILNNITNTLKQQGN